MKMFKKLMAVALAGVMALVVLTGCGSSVNEKEIIAMMNDIVKTPFAQSALKAAHVEKEIVIKAADEDVKQKTIAVAELIEKDVKEKDTIDSIIESKHNDILKAVCGENDKNGYIVSYATKVKYDSKLFNTMADGLNLAEIFTNAMDRSELKCGVAIPQGYEATGTALVGFKDVSVNGKTYTVVVMKVESQKEANH